MSKYTTDDTRHFSVFFLNKYHNFQVGESAYNRNIIWSRNGTETGRINYDLFMDQENPRIVLQYKSRFSGEEEWISMSYSVPLEAVKCHLGGVRWYFGCPNCSKRVAMLYANDHYFVCRLCANLTYESCQESKRFRGFPWKMFTNDCKADDLFKTLKRTHYRGKPTRKYQRCMDLWDSDGFAHLAINQHLSSYNENT
jgi:hypothetical protein